MAMALGLRRGLALWMEVKQETIVEGAAQDGVHVSLVLPDSRLLNFSLQRKRNEERKYRGGRSQANSTRA